MVQNDEEKYFYRLWLKRLDTIFTSVGGCKPYLLVFFNTISVFILQI